MADASEREVSTTSAISAPWADRARRPGPAIITANTKDAMERPDISQCLIGIAAAPRRMAARPAIRRGAAASRAWGTAWLDRVRALCKALHLRELALGDWTNSIIRIP